MWISGWSKVQSRQCPANCTLLLPGFVSSYPSPWRAGEDDNHRKVMYSWEPPCAGWNWTPLPKARDEVLPCLWMTPWRIWWKQQSFSWEKWTCIWTYMHVFRDSEGSLKPTNIIIDYWLLYNSNNLNDSSNLEEFFGYSILCFETSSI